MGHSRRLYSIQSTPRIGTPILGRRGVDENRNPITTGCTTDFTHFWIRYCINRSHPSTHFTCSSCRANRIHARQDHYQPEPPHIATSAGHTQIGYMWKHPGPRFLHDWATWFLHTTVSSISMLGGGYFEVYFSSEQGKMNTLIKQFKFGNQDILFTPWWADFNPEDAPTAPHTFPPSQSGLNQGYLKNILYNRIPHWSIRHHWRSPRYWYSQFIP